MDIPIIVFLITGLYDLYSPLVLFRELSFVEVIN